MGDVFGDDLLLRHICEHPMSNMMAMIDIIGGGRAGAPPQAQGRLPGMLLRLGVVHAPSHGRRRFKARHPNISELKPSEFFMRQVLDLHRVEKELAMVAELIGDDNIVYSTDYPTATRLPHAVEEFLEVEGVSRETKRKILWDNCARLYDL